MALTGRMLASLCCEAKLATHGQYILTPAGCSLVGLCGEPVAGRGDSQQAVAV